MAHALIAQVHANALTLIISPTLLAQMGAVIRRPKFQTVMSGSNTDAERMLSDLRRSAGIVDPPPLTAPVSRDPMMMPCLRLP